MPEPGKSPVSPLAVVAVIVVIGVIFLTTRSASHQGNGPSGVPAGAPGVSASSAPAWTTFQDPYEQAFTDEMPQGWKAQGGTDRVGFDDYRFMLDILSPDGQTSIRLGDPSVPPFANLDGRHPEGTVDDLGLFAQAVFAAYRTGPEFAALYARVRFYQSCQNPAADTADVNLNIPDPLISGQQSSLGRIAYLCNSGQRVAFVDTRTVPASNGWTVPTLVSFITPRAQLSQTQAIAVHMMQTFKLNPNWITYQNQMDTLGGEYMVALTQAKMAQLSAQVQQFEQKMTQEQQQFQSFDNIINGVTPTIDPLTGQARDVWTGSQSEYWVDGEGNVVNSNGDPGPDYHQITVTGP
jgi:hypothetical protein